MSRRLLATIEPTKLDTLPTKRLLARLKRLHECEESKDRSDRGAGYQTPSGFIEFKDSPEWKAEYRHLKKILAGMEHCSG